MSKGATDVEIHQDMQQAQVKGSDERLAKSIYGVFTSCRIELSNNSELLLFEKKLEGREKLVFNHPLDITQC